MILFTENLSQVNWLDPDVVQTLANNKHRNLCVRFLIQSQVHLSTVSQRFAKEYALSHADEHGRKKTTKAQQCV